MMKGLMGRCLKHEATLEHVWSKVEQTEDELNQLRSWKTKMEKKFELSEKERKELEQSTKEVKKALEGKEKEIQDLKDGLHQAKEVAVREFCDSDTLLSELGDSFLQGFDDALRQVKKAYPDLDVSNIKVEDQAQTFVLPVASDDTDALLSELGDSFLQGFEDTPRQVKKAYLDLDVSNIKRDDQAQTSVLLVASDDTDDLFAKDDGQGEEESTLVRPVTDMVNQPVPESTAPTIVKLDIQPVGEHHENASVQP